MDAPLARMIPHAGFPAEPHPVNRANQMEYGGTEPILFANVRAANAQRKN